MEKPKLQVALDCKSMVEAFRILGGGLDDTIDIVECGTMLLLHEGLHAVDFKCVAPHFGSAVLAHDPDLVTILSQAEDHVAKGITDEAKERGKGQETQIELYRDYTVEDVRKWKSYGIDHIIYNRPRDRKGPWGEEERKDLEVLVNEGMKVTATGGMSYENLDASAGLPIFAIICGRSVLKAEDPAAEALRIKQRIEELWA